MNIQKLISNSSSGGKFLDVHIDVLSKIRCLEPSLKEKISQWLAGPDPSIVHNRFLEQHQEGTGEWFLQLEAFQDWMKEPSSLLWIQGIRKSRVSRVRVLCSLMMRRKLVMVRASYG